MVKRLYITFEGGDINENGVPIDDLQMTLSQVQKAVRLMVGYLSGQEYQGGRPSDNLRLETMLRLCSISSGSLRTEWGIGVPTNSQIHLEGYGPKALDQILSCQEDLLDNKNSLPPEVVETIKAIGTSLSSEISQVTIGDSTTDRHIQIWATDKPKKTLHKSEEVLLYGSLKAINWKNGTAQLYRYEEKPVNLSFNASFNKKMKQLAMSYVKVKGLGRLKHDDTWGIVTIKEISGTRSIDEPFDLEGFKNDPPPKIFDPENMVTMSEPFDAEEFIRTIYEGR